MRAPLSLLACFAAVALAVSERTLEPRGPRLPDSWKPGVKWQIVIHAPVDVSEGIIPSDAQVWDIDYFHALQHPDIIPTLVSAPRAVHAFGLSSVLISVLEIAYTRS